MRYPQCPRRGLCVSSRFVEAGCKQLGTVLKRAGMRWTVAGANGVFVRSAVRIDGVDAGEDDWRRYEAEWLEAEESRARKALAASGTPCGPRGSPASPAAADEAGVRPRTPDGAGETADPITAADHVPAHTPELDTARRTHSR